MRYKVESEKLRNKIYTVLTGTDSPSDFPTCTCTAFAIARNRAGGKKFAASCKHIRRVIDEEIEPELDYHVVDPRLLELE